MDIHALLREKQERCEGKPSQDMLKVLLAESEEEGPNNQGLLWAYIKEAHELLADIACLVNEDILYRKILCGETTTVQVARTGKTFKIQQAKNNPTGLPAYDILSPTGKMERKGVIMDEKKLREWCYGLVDMIPWTSTFSASSQKSTSRL